MDEFFASRPAINDSYLCVGPLTKAETADAQEAGIGNGLGYYLYVSAIDSGPSWRRGRSPAPLRPPGSADLFACLIISFVTRNPIAPQRSQMQGIHQSGAGRRGP